MITIYENIEDVFESINSPLYCLHLKYIGHHPNKLRYFLDKFDNEVFIRREIANLQFGFNKFDCYVVRGMLHPMHYENRIEMTIFGKIANTSENIIFPRK